MDRDRINQLIPSVGWLRRYPKGWLRLLDGVAGLTAAAVVIPKAACQP